MTQPPVNSTPNQIAVMLGASNLTLAWPRVMTALLSRFSGPTHIYSAQGMGRSYLFPESGFAVRKLPGIFASGIWDALPTPTDSSRTFALITDLGNDLMYGSSAAEVSGSAEEAIQRLRGWSPNCDIILTAPPLASVTKLGWLRFQLARTALFPKTHLTLATAKSQTAELDERLDELASRTNVTFVRPAVDWYGLDPIHIRQRYQQSAFESILQTWQQPDCCELLSDNVLRRPTAHVRRVFNRERITPQPAVRSQDVQIFAY